MSDPESVEYLIEKAKEADGRAAAVDDPAEKLAWLRVAAFWLHFAERVLDERTNGMSPIQTMN